MELDYLSPRVAVRGQIQPKEIAGLAAAGFRAIINARPDGESPDQPASAALETEARRHGMGYWHLPVVPGEATDADAAAFARAMADAGGPVLAFCKTGNRARSLWQMSRPSR